MTSPRSARGRAWEAAAERFLTARGLEIVARSYRCRLGELDLVCRDGPALVVVEVRARASAACGSAAETVDVFKQRRIIAATRHYVMRHPDCCDTVLRFDVVAVDGIDTSAPRITWIKSAFDAS